MRLASWTWFWYVLIGFLMGGGAVYLWHFLKEKSNKLVWGLSMESIARMKRECKPLLR